METTLSIKRIIINTATGTGARILALGVSFVTTPILVNHLSADAFGIWALVSTLPAYAGLLDFGIGPGLVRHLTAFSETGDTKSVRHVMTFSLTFYIMLGLVLIPITYWLAPDIANLFVLPKSMKSVTEFSIVVMAGYFVVSSMVGVFSSRLISVHRMDVASGIGLVSQIIYAILVVVFIPIFPTVETAVWLVIVQIVISGVLTYAAIYRIDRRIFSNPLHIPGTIARVLFSFGGWMQINSLTSLINLEADKLIIGGLLNMAAVTPYQIGNRLAALNRIIPLQLLSAVMPAATIVQVGSDQAQSESFYSQTSRYLMLITLLIAGFTIVSADQLIYVWIGRPIESASFIVVALSMSYAVNNLTGGGTTMVKAAGKPRFETYYAVISMILNIGLTIALAPFYGLKGIIAGTIIGNVLGSVYFLVLYHRAFHIPWFSTMGTWLWRILIAAVVAGSVVWLAEYSEPSLGRIPSAGFLGLNFALYGIAYVFALKYLRFWTPDDIAAVAKILGKARLLRRRVK